MTLRTGRLKSSVPEDGNEVDDASDSDQLDSFLGQPLEPSPGVVLEGKGLPEDENIDEVADSVS